METGENARLHARTSNKAKPPKSLSEGNNALMQDVDSLLNSPLASCLDNTIDTLSGDRPAGIAFPNGTSSTLGPVGVNSAKAAANSNLSGEVDTKELENGVQAQNVIAGVEMAVANTTPIVHLGTSIPISLETTATGLDSAIDGDINGVDEDPVVKVTQNNARTSSTDIVGDADVNGLADGNCHNPP
jgi:hypothetical protein